jgi:transposase-like protein
MFSAMNLEELPQSLLEATRYFADEEKCHEFLVAMRWPDGVRCAHCKSENVGKLVISGKRRLWNCKGCKKQFTAKVGTIFQDSPLGLDKWLPAIWMVVNAKNGVSSCELARALDIAQKSAWHMGHRIRLAMHEGIFNLCGEVEADETWVGGKARFMHIKKLLASKRKRAGAAGLTPVAGLLERSTGGRKSRVKVKVVPNIRQTSLLPNVLNNVTPGSKVFTDSLLSYRTLKSGFDHEVIDHMIEYARGKVHTNGMENFWSLLKRTLKGTYVSVSPFHLKRYLDEQARRFNEREDNDAGRFVKAMKGVSGRHLTYAKLIRKGDAQA